MTDTDTAKVLKVLEQQGKALAAIHEDLDYLKQNSATKRDLEQRVANVRNDMLTKRDL